MTEARLQLDSAHSSNTSTSHAVAAAVLVYDEVCHLLSISARADCRSLIAAPFPFPSAAFRTRRFCFADEHIVALCCAMLTRFGAPCALVRRFLSESIARVMRTVSNNMSIPLLRYDSSTSDQPRKRARSMPFCAVDFSCNALLSPRGASAVLAACLLIPGPWFVELDLHKCSAVTSISLRPWVPFLAAEKRRQPGVPFATLTGLRLDGCPLTFLELDTLRLVQDLRWISLRYTGITNLWRCAEVMSSLPSLVAALFKGTRSASRDIEQLEEAKKVSHAVLLSRRSSEVTASPYPRAIRNGEENGALNRSNSVEELESFSELEKGGRRALDVAELITHTADPLTTTPTSSEESVSQRSLDSQDFIRMADIANCLRGTRPTPVTRAPYFSEFMISNASVRLQLLDDIHVTRDQREAAIKWVDKRFERSRPMDGLEHHLSMLSLIKNREDGFSRSSYRIHGGTKLITERRQKKRRRTVEESTNATDIFAAVAAAGFPAIKRPGRLSPETSLTVALAAASSRSEVEPTRSNAAFEKVQDAAFSTQLSQRGEASTDVAPLPEECREEKQKKQPSKYGGLHSFCEPEFEAAVSFALVKKRGAPRIQYLHQEQDRPRQFEYNPAKPAEIVYGTEHGFLVVMDQETGEVKGSCLSGGGAGYRETGEVIPQTSKLSSISWGRGGFDTRLSEPECAPVYGLCWLNKRSDRFLSGNNDGAIHVYDVEWMGSGRKGGCIYACETFERLTSLHVSCDDVTFAVSGWRPDVGLYDLETGQRRELMRGCHQQAINVIKFAHKNPYVLLTSSFDQYVKKWDLRESRPGGGRRPIFEARSRTDNVMACFSPDDSRLLVSAVDNEVRQYVACDGRLEMEFDIPKSGSCHNFTRSYYMNDRDYIITGSCMETVVRVYNARSGAFFTEVDMDNRETKGNRRLYVQTLRSNPIRKFNFSTILASDPRTMHGLIANTDLHRR